MTRRSWKCRKRERIWLSCCKRYARPGEWVTITSKQGAYVVPWYKHRYGCPQGVVG
jgi:hypothetical protein